MPRTQLKRNLSSSSSPSSSPEAVHKKSKIFISPNRYAALSEDSVSTAEVFSPPPVPDQTTIQGEVTVDHLSPSGSPSYEVLKSPPIIIKNISDLNGLKSYLISIVGSKGFTLRSSKDFLKITTPNCKYNKQILDYLKESDLSFHTFAPRHTIPIVAFIRSNTTHIRKTPPKVPSNEAKEVNAQPRPKRYAEAIVSDNSSLDIVSTMLSQFISNLNSLISPLIFLLTEVLQKHLSP
ncbi:hypothetical protein QTP88_009175 [Uroleucon formosanum]